MSSLCDTSAAAFYFDLETTGLNPYADSIIEIGISTSDCSKSLSVLIQPPHPISPQVEYITGIKQSMLEKEGTDLLSAIRLLHSFIREHLSSSKQKVWLIGHNSIGFDRIFYQRALETVKVRPLRPSIQWFDSLYLARYSLPQMNSFKLISIAKYLKKANSQEHRALADCHLLSLVFPTLLHRALQKMALKKQPNLQTLLSSLNQILCAGTY
jgi:DNA polymerase III alpha subunit (gram-positive type)